MRVCMALLPLAVAGCQEWAGPVGGGRVTFWAAPEGQFVERTTPEETENAVFSRSNNAIRLEGAVNETAACQVVLRGASRRATAISNVRVDAFEPPDGRAISSEHVRLYRLAWIAMDTYPSWYLRLGGDIRRSREYPDVLIPLSASQGAVPLTLSSEGNELIWMEVRVPPGTSPGVYRSRLHLDVSAGGSESCEIALRVHPFALPMTHHLGAVAELSARALLAHHLEMEGQPYAPSRLSPTDPYFDRSVVLIDEAARLLRAHRCDPVITDITPGRTVNMQGEIELNWGDYDRIVSGMIEGDLFADRIPAPYWPLPLSHEDPPPASYGGWDSPGYQAMLGAYLGRCVTHFRARGWAGRHYARLPLPTLDRSEAYALYRDWAREVRATDDQVRLVCPLTPYRLERYGRRDAGYHDLEPWVSIWAPSAGVADRDALLKIREQGASVWLRPHEPPYSGNLSLLATPQDIRSLAWMAYRYQADALDLGPVNAWRSDGYLAAARDAPPLIWPGKPYGLAGPVPSLRLKRLRRGLQDAAYLWLLETNGRPAVARQMAIDLCPGGGTSSYGEHLLDGVAGGWVRERAVWQLASRLMTRELVSVMGAGNEPIPAPDETLRDRLAWSRLMESVRRVQTHLEGVRVRDDATSEELPYTIDSTVTLFNATGRQVSGRLTLGEAPEDWTVPGLGTAIGGLEAGKSLREVVSARTSSIAPSLYGATPIAVRLDGEEIAREEIRGRLALLEAQRLEKPIVIDGKLDDWPLGVNNVAGDFLLVGARSAPKRDRSEPDRPLMRTTVFVGRDETDLYLAFRCEEDQMDKRTLLRGNVVHYDGLWPTGEDLVEVVLDPTGRGLSAGDLYHVVLKANGAVVAEKGVPCLEPVAPREDWPVQVEAMIDDRSLRGVWTAELRIPLSAFPGRAAVWGLNFARYHARDGEYSSWSGADRHIYSPASLGNMRIAP